MLAVGRAVRELQRAGTILENRARESRPSEFDAQVRREIARIERAIRPGDDRLVKREYGDLQDSNESSS